MKQEIESLRELREIAGKTQAEVAVTLKIKQPSISKIEKQADMYLSTFAEWTDDATEGARALEGGRDDHGLI